MGTARFESIFDYCHRKVDLAARCVTCQRVAVFDADEVRLYLQARLGITKRLEPFPALICRCGSREMRFHPVSRSGRPEPLPARRPMLRALYVREAET